MPSFPLLKSGQSSQYPVRRTVMQNVQTISFLDGSEQRCATSATLHQWRIQLSLIDEEELSALESFFSQMQGQTGQFVFTDPLDGTVYNNCSFVNGEVSETFRSPGRTATELIIRENPN